MHALGTFTLLLGILVLATAQLYLTGMTLKADRLRGLLCFVLPGYALFIAKRNGFYGKFLAAYVVGILGLIIGGSILS